MSSRIRLVKSCLPVKFNHCADKVADRFPLHKDDLEGLGVQSYLAIPVASAGGEILGHLAVMDRKPMGLEQLDLSVFKVFGSRAGAELERLHMERFATRKGGTAARPLRRSADRLRPRGTRFQVASVSIRRRWKFWNHSR